MSATPAPAPSTIATPAEVTTLLGQYRASPPTAPQLTESLPKLFDFLNYYGGDDVRKEAHWFTERWEAEGGGAVRETAAFLIRLHAYNSDVVNKFKYTLAQQLARDINAVNGYEDAKSRSRIAYLWNFKPTTLQNFFNAVLQWEKSAVLPALSSVPDLASVPPALLYHIFANIDLLLHPEIRLLVFPRLPGTAWAPPAVPPPPGLFLLLALDDEHAKRWAWESLHSSNWRVIGVKDAQRYSRLMSELSKALEAIDQGAASGATLLLVHEKRTLWEAVAFLLAAMDADALGVALKDKDSDIVRLVLGHLHDRGDHFPSVLSAFSSLLRTSSELWAHPSVSRTVDNLRRTATTPQSAHFAQVIVDAVFDNPAYEALLLEPTPPAYPRFSRDEARDVPWPLAWWEDYVRSVWDAPVLREALANLARRGLEEMAQSRWGEKRVGVLESMFKILSFVHEMTAGEFPVRRRDALHAVLDIHSQTIVAVAFTKAFADPLWARPRSLARDFILAVFRRDSAAMQECVLQLGQFYTPWRRWDDARERGKDRPRPTEKLEVEPVRIAKSLWDTAYTVLAKGGTSATAFSLVLQAVVPVAHIEPFREEIYKLLSVPTAYQQRFRSATSAINAALGTVLAPFPPQFERLATLSKQEQLAALLDQEAVASAAVQLLLSPLDAVHAAALAFVREALDAYSRSDALRELLMHSPTAVLDGICEFIQTFNRTANEMLEATNMAKWMVRCFADVIENLCSPTEGLLERELRDVQDVPRRIFRFWSGTCEANGIIFLQSQKWAPLFANNVMTEWMRDAIILAREMLGHFKTFERALTQTDAPYDPLAPSPAKISNNGLKMVAKLDETLRHLIGWLRLTETELLYQSYQLVISMLERFVKSDVKPSTDLIETLQKFGKKKKGYGTKLSPADLLVLQDNISAWVTDVSDDDVTIVERSTASARSSARPSPASSTSPAPSSARAPAARPTSSKAFTSAPKPTSSLVRNGDIASYFREKAAAAQPKPAVPKMQPRDKAHPFMQEKRPEAPAKGKAAVPSKPPKRPFVASTNLTYAGNKRRRDNAASSDGSSSSDEDGGLACVAAVQREPKLNKPRTEGRRQVMMLDADGGARTALQRVQDQQQQLHRRRLRLTPDLGELHRQILHWNFDDADSDPPWMSKERLRRVPDYFASPKDYNDIMEPLLMLECWQQLAQAKEEIARTDVIACELAGRAFVDDWLEVHFSIKSGIPQGWYINDVDVVLLTQASSRPGQKPIRVIAKVVNFARRPDDIQTKVRLANTAIATPQVFAERTQWRLQKLFSLSTIHREYAALRGVQYYDLADQVYNPHLDAKRLLQKSDVDNAMRNLQLNEPQAKAVLSSMHPQSKGFSLIQGPPGTGKTKTILGLVAKFISSRPTPIAAPDRSGKSQKSEPDPPPKLLVCAPSNAAIDEIARRLKDPIRGARGQMLKVNVVRIGAESSMNVSVKDISLDELVDQKLNAADLGDSNTDGAQATLAALRAEMDGVRQEINAKHAEIDSLEGNSTRRDSAVADLNALKARRATLSTKIDAARDKHTSSNRARDAARRKYRMEVLLEADVICSTLSGAGHEVLGQLPFGFDTVIIDEAAQAIELSTLIPLKYGCQRAILVGDPHQLPPTVLSTTATDFNYSQSLFVRLMKQKEDAVHLLSIQYRMHPEISVLPSKLFYESRLSDGPQMVEKTKQPWHASPLFGVYKFFDVAHGGEQQARGHSLINTAEADLAASLYHRLMGEYGDKTSLDYRVAVVTMYKEQVFELKRRFRSRFGQDVLSKVDINTVDGFQGQEKTVIILSCVRGGPNVQSIGFLGDKRRMNVALTRSQSSLFVLGHAATLERSHPTWRTIVQDARERGFLVKCPQGYFSGPANKAPVVHAAPPKGPKKQQLPKGPAAMQPPKGPAAMQPPPDLILLGGPKPSPSGAQKRLSAQPLSPSTKKPRIGDDAAASSDGASGAEARSTNASSPMVIDIDGDQETSGPLPASDAPNMPSPAEASRPHHGTGGPGVARAPGGPPQARPPMKKKAAPTLFIPRKPVRKPNASGPSRPP